MGICAGVMGPFQMIYVYIGDVLRTKFYLLPPQILSHNMQIMLLMMGVLPLMGYVADKVGYKRAMSFSLLRAMVTSYPAFWVIERAISPSEVLMMQGVLAILACGVAGPCCVFLSSLFPTKERYSGYALGWSLGSILFAGLTPLLSLLFVQWTGNSKSPAYLLMFYAMTGLFAMIEMPRIKTLHFSEVPSS